TRYDSKDETPEVLKDFLTMIQRNLQAQVINIRTDRGTEFLNKSLNAFFKEEGIKHQTFTARTPEKNGVVERQNRTLFALILGYGDLVQGNVMINRVYYVEGLNHNLFSVGQFCDADLDVAFRKSTCFVRDLQGNDLLIGNCRSDLYTISHQESTSSTLLCLMAKATPT
nr:integrase, catalytic region, zinc finger, CCHC-type, peptidase aspartic, catalytic [Tanacetum cinerariifolium]